MPAPTIRLFLIRHGLSEANLDKAVNSRVADHAVALAPEGHEQAEAAGQALRDYLTTHPNPDAGALPSQGLPPGMEYSHKPRRARMFVSPYRRTRQTADGVVAGFGGQIPHDRREAIELREISFGLFDGLEDHEIPEVFPREHAYYEKHKAFEGEFFAPMPLGESRVQVMDRVKTIFGTIQRDASPDREDPILDFFIVSHGVTLRTFETAWMHHPWEFYGSLRNPANCSIKLIEGAPGRGYNVSEIFQGFRTERKTQQAIREADGVDGKSDIQRSIQDFVMARYADGIVANVDVQPDTQFDDERIPSLHVTVTIRGTADEIARHEPPRFIAALRAFVEEQHEAFPVVHYRSELKP